MRPKPALLLLLVTTAIFLFIYVVNKHAEPVSTPHIDQKPLPTQLNPVVNDKKDELISLAEKKGITMVVTDGFRSIEEQNQLYQIGRNGSGRIVTNVRGGESFHNFGLAFDYALKNKSGQVIWDTEYDGNKNGKSDWMEVAGMAKNLGFEWGGDWTGFKDFPHLQMTFDLTINDLRRGERPETT